MIIMKMIIIMSSAVQGETLKQAKHSEKIKKYIIIL